jgi:hypothetical protein
LRRTANTVQLSMIGTASTTTGMSTGKSELGAGET